MRGNSDAEADMLSLAASAVFPTLRDHRPMVSSPLTSSPIRVSTPPHAHNSSPPHGRAMSPLSPSDRNSLPKRQVQSSPIRSPPPKFKYASRPMRPNPLLRSSEAGREVRRRNFFQRIRDQADERAWQRRDIETQFLKNNWLANIGCLSHDAPCLTEADLVDAMALQPDEPQPPEDEDEMTAEMYSEQEEMEAIAASFEDQHITSTSDDEYDEIFAELALQDTPLKNHPPDSSDHMDLT
ncbi:hypothetical protein CP533_5966 [Ophiocordyceps camponoti-saundersi (nom. inval.)]|nr:hypothetical protein CP533_5966 [Ophiocordyceps camponoti-saundersi (nom. inval.)]